MFHHGIPHTACSFPSTLLSQHQPSLGNISIMRPGRIFELLASASFAVNVFAASQPQKRAESSALAALEVAANSRLPNIPLPKEISNSTKTLLQFMTIWGEAEVASMSETLDKISKNATGFTDFGIWSRANVSSILSRHLAVRVLCSRYRYRYSTWKTNDEYRRMSSFSTTPSSFCNNTRCH